RYVAGADTRGRQEGRPYPWSQQVIREISGLLVHTHAKTNGYKNRRIRDDHELDAHLLSADSLFLRSR
ncbi:MAG: hypothetical protein PVI74_15865, partial [Syntrophobacterales bacterium]